MWKWPRTTNRRIGLVGFFAASLCLFGLYNSRYRSSAHDPAPPLHVDKSKWPLAEDKVVVMASMETEDVSWVGQSLPEYFPIHPR